MSGLYDAVERPLASMRFAKQVAHQLYVLIERSHIVALASLTSGYRPSSSSSFVCTLPCGWHFCLPASSFGETALSQHSPEISDRCRLWSAGQTLSSLLYLPSRSLRPWTACVREAP